MACAAGCMIISLERLLHEHLENLWKELANKTHNKKTGRASVLKRAHMCSASNYTDERVKLLQGAASS